MEMAAPGPPGHTRLEQSGEGPGAGGAVVLESSASPVGLEGTEGLSLDMTSAALTPL